MTLDAVRDPDPELVDHKIILGREFIKALLAAGIVRIEDNVSRVVIDIRADRVLTLYVERFGDERLLSLVPSLEGVGITWAPKDAT